MANILLITSDTASAQFVNTKAAFVSRGHTVTGTLGDTASLDAAWASGTFHLIADVYLDYKITSTTTAWISTKWASGTPVLAGGAPTNSNATGTAAALGIINSQYPVPAFSKSDILVAVAGHPITAGFTAGSNVTISTGGITEIYDRSGTPVSGTVLGTYFYSSSYSGPYMTAVDAGQAINGTAANAPGATAPARAVFCGWLYGGQADYTADGKTILGQAIDWLTTTGPVTPKAKVATPAKVGLTFQARLAVRAKVATLTAVRLAFTAVSRTNAATSTPVTVGLSFAAEAHAPTAITTGARVGLGFTATPVLATTTRQGVAVGLAFHASQPQVYTVKTGASVGLTFQAASVVPTTLSGWTIEDTGKDTFPVDLDSPVALVVTPQPSAAPDSFVERPLLRNSHQMPALAPGETGDGNHPVVTGTVGVPHVWISGVDVTYLRGVPTVIGEFDASLPGGEETLDLTFPQITPADRPGTGDLSMFRSDAPVEVAMIGPDGYRDHQWSGHLIDREQGNTSDSTTGAWTAVGDLVAADHVQHSVPLVMDPTDIGEVIAHELNRVVSRRYGAIRPVTTGILTSDRGSGDDTAWGYVQDLLSTAWTEAGEQWTVAPVPGVPRQYQLVKKPFTKTVWTVTSGAPGVEVDLTRDESQRLNVIYGRGVQTDGYAWSGWCFPNLRTDDAPPYPNASSGNVIAIGTTDAMTDSGDGVSTWQRQARELGYKIAVDGVYNDNDARVVRAVQAAYGIQVDGRIGPQTWVATFATGSNAGDLNGAYRRPLAIDKRVDPNLYAANGAIVGKNPDYDPSIIRYETSIDYGTGIAKAEGRASAQLQVARDANPGWSGTVSLLTDPWEGSRSQIREGDKLTILGWNGAPLDVWVVTREVDPSNGWSVNLTVDSKYRDAMTLGSILTRNRESRNTPGRRPGNIDKQSHQTRDIVEFDGDSGAGVIPRLPLFANLWSVIHIPVSLVGSIALLDVRTEGPVAPFVLAMFGAPITAANLLDLVGNPLTSDNGWTKHADELANKWGWIETYGTPDDPAGYYPGNKSADGSSLTGRLYDTNSLQFTSTKGGWVWVAMFSSVSTHISGTVRPGPIPV